MISSSVDPKMLTALVGRCQHHPNIGNYEGQYPSILPGDGEREGAIGAIDRLRPHHERALDEVVAQQRLS